MTNKERFIKAIKETKESTGSYGDCKLCQITGKYGGIESCIPCPFSGEHGKEGCWDVISILEPTIKKEKDRVSYYKRTVIKMLEETPAKYFTEKNWVYFKKLHEYVDKIYKKLDE